MAPEFEAGIERLENCDHSTIASSGYEKRVFKEEKEMDKLNSGAAFPRLSLKTTGGDNLILPDSLGTPLTIVLFYRGYW